MVFFILIKMQILIINVNQGNLAELVEQAKMVRTDLEKMLNQSVDLSQEVSTKMEKMTQMLQEKKDLSKTESLEEVNSLATAHTSYQQAAIQTLEATARFLEKTDTSSASNTLFHATLAQEMETYPIEKLEQVFEEEEIFKAEIMKEMPIIEVEHPFFESTVVVPHEPVAPKQEEAYAEVQKLLDQGFSIKDIAKKMNRGQGEIQLLINLYHKKN